MQKVVRRPTRYSETRPCERVSECDFRSVEHQPRRPTPRGLGGMNGVPEDGKTSGRQVNPNLMLPPCGGASLDEQSLRQALENTNGSHCDPSILSHRHPPSGPVGRLANWSIDDE